MEFRKGEWLHCLLLFWMNYSLKYNQRVKVNSGMSLRVSDFGRIKRVHVWEKIISRFFFLYEGRSGRYLICSDLQGNLQTRICPLHFLTPSITVKFEWSRNRETIKGTFWIAKRHERAVNEFRGMPRRPVHFLGRWRDANIYKGLS